MNWVWNFIFVSTIQILFYNRKNQGLSLIHYDQKKYILPQGELDMLKPLHDNFRSYL